MYSRNASSLTSGGISVWLVVLLICAAVFLYITTGQDRLERAVKCGCYDKVRIKQGQWWRLLTVGFTHIQPWHVIMNLYSLYNLSALESVYGHAWFSLILFGSVLGGSIVEYRLSDIRYSVGLSGGLYGLMFSYFVLIIHYGSASSLRSILITLLMNLAINFMPNIAWQAHLGGALTGTVLTMVYLAVR